jgi:hypothetical protein
MTEQLVTANSEKNTLCIFASCVIQLTGRRLQASSYSRLP